MVMCALISKPGIGSSLSSRDFDADASSLLNAERGARGDDLLLGKDGAEKSARQAEISAGS
jgi:hypothetical protein